MVWVRFEDGYPRNRKVAALSDAAFRLDVSAICWSNSTGADGRILPHELQEIRAKATSRHAAELVANGRWHVAGTACPHDTCPPSTGDGWVIHDIWEQQKPAAVVDEEKKARAERQRRYMEKVNASRKRPSDDASVGASRDAPVDVLEDDAPSPPRPAPKGRGGTDVPPALPAAVGGRLAADSEAKPVVASLDERALAARAAADLDAQRRATEAHDAATQRGLAAARAALRRPADPAA